MKKILFVAFSSCFFFLTHQVQGQDTLQQKLVSNVKADSNKQARTLVKTINDLKTGNLKDVLTSFFQLGFNDLTGKDRAFEFKANLFGLKAKVDSTLFIDTNYVRQNFSRNFQFDFALKLDSQYRFNGLKAGFTWAIINKRDTSLLNLIRSPADVLFAKSMTSLSAILENFRNSLRTGNFFKSPNDSLLYLKVKAVKDDLLDNNKPFDPKAFPKQFIDFADLDIVAKKFNDFDELYNEELSKMRQRPLLTLSVNSVFMDQSGLFNNGAMELVYLQGLTKKGKNLELDIRGKLGVFDTTASTRVEFNSSGGFNWAIINAFNNKNKSLVEFKPYFEYNSILKGRMPGEEKEKFTANAELRIRVLDDLWIPLTLKYDLKDHNFLGFLKVALNMNAFKKPEK